MAIDVRIECDVIGGGDGHVVRVGTLGIPVELTGGTLKLDRAHSLNTSGSTIFDNTVDLTDFNLLVLLPAADVVVEFTAGAANFKWAQKFLAGIPHILSTDQAAATLAGSLEAIKRIDAKSVTGTAKLRILAIT